MLSVATLAAVMGACGGGPATTTSVAPATTTTTVTTTTAPTPTTSAWSPPEHRVTIVGGEFVDRTTGGRFVPRGTNYFLIDSGRDRFVDPAVFDRATIDADFARLAGLGYNTVRVFLDTCDCIGRTDGTPGLRDDTLDTIAEVMDLAADHGLVLILTSNDLPDEGGYRDIAAAGTSADFAGYRNTDFLTGPGHDAMVAYWDDLMAGLAAREAAFDVVLGWSILNEQWLFGDQPPLSLTSGTVTSATGTYDMGVATEKRQLVVDAIRELTARVATTIRSHDPDALVTMGFFAPQFPNPTSIGGTWYVDTAPLVADSALDFFDFHAYPGEDIDVAAMAQNFGIDASKPVVMGEVGAFVDRYGSAEAAGLAVQRWIADSCPVGFDGWVYWGYLRAPLADATWALTDAEGYLLDALAPVNQPDPCVMTLVDPDAARDRPVVASRSLPEEPPEFAVDGNPATQWGSGADAPQWIEVDVRGTSVAAVRLTVAQFPSGRTVHDVIVTDALGTYVAHTFDGETEDGDVLEVAFDPPLELVTDVRIETRASPSWVSWRSVEVLRP